MASSIFSKIQKIREETSQTGSDKDTENYVLHKYRIEFDDIKRIIYVNAEVHPDSLDKGTEMPEDEKDLWLFRIGIYSADNAVQIIDKKLGGTEYDANYIALNKQLDLTEWKSAEEAVYNHVKKGENRHAQINFAFEYDDDEDIDYITRPVTLYYCMALYHDNKVHGDAMEGIIENLDPNKEIQK